MNLREKLSKEILDTCWKPLAEHFARGAVYYLEAELDIVDVGEAMANDEISSIKQWLDNGLMYPPTSDQATQFAQDDNQRFSMLIVEPYVLVQRKGLS